MILSFISHVIAAWFAFLIPVFGTFKALKHRPVSEPDLERWTKYWSVVGLIVCFEYLGEWVISWVPFYWEAKTAFLLFLALPQTQGSTYIYDTYILPFMTRNEAEFDADIVTIQGNVFSFASVKFAIAWNALMGAANKNAAQQGQPGVAPAGAPSMGAALDMFRAYAPAIASALRPASAPASAPAAVSPSVSPYASTASTPNAATEAAPPFPEPQHVS
ncbi:unnamed protein product [Mycena citricolor]|uniref:Protein YOP1 n=1 Tax=Mycena citricolor TaxID=2018698 RepID=A0AAD2GXY1_9AGAR|nr:unnamed protein product [Mycena citricolor]CAK5280002.1 unnamed protein product [Mycena citricolor]